MRRGKLRRCLAATGLAHALPQRHRLARIKARRGGEHQAHFIGLGFVAARIRQQVAVAHRRHHHLLLLRVHAAGGAGHLPDLGQLLLGHALGTMAQQRMGDLVAHHHGHRIHRARHRDQPGVDRHLAAGQAERIGLFGLDHVDFPLEVAREMRRLQPVLFGQRGFHHVHLGNQALCNRAHVARYLRVGIHRPFLRQDLLVGLQPEGFFLVGVQRTVDEHAFTGVRVHRAVGEPVEGGITGERQQHPPADVAEQPWTPGAALLLAAEWIVAHGAGSSLDRRHPGRHGVILVAAAGFDVSAGSTPWTVRCRAPGGTRSGRWWCPNPATAARPRGSVRGHWPSCRRGSPAAGSPG